MLMSFGEFDSMLARMAAFRRSMDHLFDEFEQGPAASTQGGWPRTNMSDDGKMITVKADVPGMSPDDIDVQLQGNMLAISGKRNINAPEGYSVHRSERLPVQFSRSFTLPADVDPDKTKATVVNGVLTLELTKSEKAMPKQIEIKTM